MIRLLFMSSMSSWKWEFMYFLIVMSMLVLRVDMRICWIGKEGLYLKCCVLIIVFAKETPSFFGKPIFVRHKVAMFGETLSKHFFVSREITTAGCLL